MGEKAEKPLMVGSLGQGVIWEAGQGGWLTYQLERTVVGSAKKGSESP